MSSGDKGSRHVKPFYGCVGLLSLEPHTTQARTSSRRERGGDRWSPWTLVHTQESPLALAQTYLDQVRSRGIVPRFRPPSRKDKRALVLRHGGSGGGREGEAGGPGAREPGEGHRAPSTATDAAASPGPTSSLLEGRPTRRAERPPSLTVQGSRCAS